MKFRVAEDSVAVVTGGGGAIGGAIAEALAGEGVRIAIWDLSPEAAERRAVRIQSAAGAALSVLCNVTRREDVEEAVRQTESALGPVNILINSAGGSRKESTTSPDLSFFDIPEKAMASTMALNYSGTVLPCQAVGRGFAERGKGVVLNIASIGGLRPLTRSVAYSNAKAAVVNFTEWLGVHMAQEYSPRIRVNALAPGFVLTDQNRFLLEDAETGEPTERGRTILGQVPMRRYGLPEEMVGAALWLVSDASSFVTGITVPVDGGLAAFLGV